jgi:hypothetical protein
MNFIKLLLQKIGLVGAVVLLWLLDAIPIISDTTAWTITSLFLTVIVRITDKDRIDALKKYWTITTS